MYQYTVLSLYQDPLIRVFSKRDNMINSIYGTLTRYGFDIDKPEIDLNLSVCDRTEFTNNNRNFEPVMIIMYDNTAIRPIL